MIQVECEVDKSVPPDKELILFDRNAFQSIPKDVLTEISKRYNIFCPIHFVIECLSPNNGDNKALVLFEKEKKSLREKLESIENPIIFTGSTNVIYKYGIYANTEYTDILASWQIARNCIINYPVTMKRISSDDLVLKCKTKIWDIKNEFRELTESILPSKGRLSPNRYRLQVQKQDQLRNISRSLLEIKRELRKNPSTDITQELTNVATHALRDIEAESKSEIVEGFKTHFGLIDENMSSLRYQIKNYKTLTSDNYPRLSYPIYIYFLIRYMLYGIMQGAKHIDDSFFPDFQYFHYLNFCDRFIADETSTRHIVKAIPFSEISNIRIMTSKELIKELA